MLGLLLLTPALAACKDGSAVRAGDVIPARRDAQFAGRGTETTVALPIGRLEITAGSPVAEISADDTRQREKVKAPAGSVFVPITWQYDAETFGAFAAYLDTNATPVVDLVVSGASYRLPAPEQTGQGSESFYVLIDGRGDKPAMSVDFDGVTQTADLSTGDVDKGQAAPLYDLRTPRTKMFPCAANPTFNRTVQGTPTFTCETTRALRLPYAGNAWATDGHTWLAVTVSTAQGRWDEIAPDLASGALYYPTSVKGAFALGGVAATEALRDPGRGTCPDLANANCSAVFHVMFDVDKSAPQTLTVEQDYAMARTSTWGKSADPETLDLTVTAQADLRK